MNGRRNRTVFVGFTAGVAGIALAAWLICHSSTAAQEPMLAPPVVQDQAAPLPPPLPPTPMPAQAAPAPGQSPPESSETPPAGTANPNVEVLTRGPIHEAYATPESSVPTPGLVVPKRPPPPIEEQAPEVKPQGDRAIWIPGYWSWDDDRKDFIWVSGVWRVPPPGNHWVPGYWQEAQGGWQWVPGYWMQAAKTEMVYLPKPPDSLEQGPTSPSPGDAYFWIPGHWQWIADHYVWVPGYWALSRQDLVWVYPSYYWSPRGWIYSDGYWDYPLEDRGLLFAPVYFAEPVPFYQPGVVVDVGVLGGSLFCRPGYYHYYYGDYYGDRYVAMGIRPWFVYGGPRYGYDPLFCYYRTYYRNDPHWEANLRGWHDYYRAHPEMRPPHTLGEQQRLLASPNFRNRPDARSLAMAHPVGQLRNNPSAPIRVQSVPVNQRIAIQQSARQVSSIKSERVAVETQGRVGGLGRIAGAGPTRPDRVSLSRMPTLQAAGARTPALASHAWPSQRAYTRSYGGRSYDGRSYGARSYDGRSYRSAWGQGSQYAPRSEHSRGDR